MECLCGCGDSVRPGKQFVIGHHSRVSNPFKGRKHSDESKKAISEAKKGVPLLKGRKFSEEHKRRLSVSAKARPDNKERGYQMGISRRGIPHSEEHRRRIGLAHRGMKRSLITRERIRQEALGRRASEETKLKLSKINKKRWSDPQFRNSMIRILRKAAASSKPNKPEQKLQRFLDNRYPGEWKYVGDGSFILDGYNPDFINVNGRKLIIELFGDYWHQGEDPADRAKVFEPYGFKTLVIWQHELKNLLAVGSKVRELTWQP